MARAANELRAGAMERTLLSPEWLAVMISFDSRTHARLQEMRGTKKRSWSITPLTVLLCCMRKAG
jgi:hypothetical protein